MKEIQIGKNDAGQRLDKFLQKTFPDLKKSMMYKGLRNKKIKVNRKRAAFDQKLEEGDCILLFLPEDALGMKTRRITGNPDIDVQYEDENILIVNKPAGLLSQKDSPLDQDTLNDRILAYLYRKGSYDPQKEQSFIPAVCHRLDRNTSGLVIAAKSAAGARAVNEAIRNHEIGKKYLAVVQGKPEQADIHLYMKKEGTKAVVSDQEKEGYRPAKMHVQILEQADGKSLAEIDLYTGRFHQIRAGMAYLGCPLAGDRKYGSHSANTPYQLQAYRLETGNLHLPGVPETVELPVDKRIHL